MSGIIQPLAGGVVTWSGTGMGPGTTLSNGNLTVTTTSTNGGAFATSSVEGGKYYWEVTLVSGSNNTYIGCLQGGTTLSSDIQSYGSTVIITGWGGTIWSGGSGAGYGISPLTVGNTVCFATDAPNRRFWVRNAPSGQWNGSTLNGDPTSGTGSVSLTSYTPATPVIQEIIGTTTVYTANFGATAFVGAVPSGFVALGTPPSLTATTWNPADLTATTLSNGNFTAATTGAGGVRSVFSVSSGKWYWEVTPTAGAASNLGIGMADATATLSSVWTTPTHAVVAYNGATYVNNVSVSGSFPPTPVGAALCVAVDMGARRIWFRSGAAGQWNGSGSFDPAAGTGGYDLSPIGATLFALVCSSVTGQTYNANFGAAGFVGTPPAGFVAGLGAPLVSPMQRALVMA